jgi:predicted DCC family thiol-disulfide oxidoreductase YuxK
MPSRRVPVLIYDADCGFCRSWIVRWRRSTGARVRYLPFQRLWVRWRYGVRRRDARIASQLIDVDGRRYAGAAAMLRALLRASSPWLRLFARLALAPGARSIAGAAYRTIARHRRATSRLQRRVEKILGPPVPQSRFWLALSRPGLALRGLGAIYFAAFSSLRAQVLGLYGTRGILPVRDQLARVRDTPLRRPGARGWLERLAALPTLLWLDPSDAGLLRLCRVGQLAGAALAFDIAPRASAAVAWGAYLSFASIGRVFLRFQWDGLLLEAGLHAMLGRRRRLLMRLLAFRLQLESGMAKLASHDPTWRDLSACCYHQETQPLPTPLGWYAHHLPRRIQRYATILTLVAECAVPLLALGPRRLRQPAFVILTGFQGLIAATGNYAFFNLLTAVLNLAVIEQSAPLAARGRAADAFAVVEDLLAAGVLALDLAELAARLRPDARPLLPIQRVNERLAPFHAVGSYGLFSVMTTERPEIVIEGSDDGASWREYGFRYKPGDVMRPPSWVAPHQPRLDWQMWFAALNYAPPPWFEAFLARVLEGSPDVLALLGTNPFPEKPPRYLRALLYDYRIADRATHRRTGAWWVRTLRGLYFPPCALRAEE